MRERGGHPDAEGTASAAAALDDPLGAQPREREAEGAPVGADVEAHQRACRDDRHRPAEGQVPHRHAGARARELGRGDLGGRDREVARLVPDGDRERVVAVHGWAPANAAVPKRLAPVVAAEAGHHPRLTLVGAEDAELRLLVARPAVADPHDGPLPRVAGGDDPRARGREPDPGPPGVDPDRLDRVDHAPLVATDDAQLVLAVRDPAAVVVAAVPEVAVLGVARELAVVHEPAHLARPRSRRRRRRPWRAPTGRSRRSCRRARRRGSGEIELGVAAKRSTSGNSPLSCWVTKNAAIVAATSTAKAARTRGLLMAAER